MQKSLLDWFSGSNVNLLGLIEQLEHWKEKTYEGKKVPFAFLINPQSTQGEFNFMEFLEDVAPQYRENVLKAYEYIEKELEVE